MSADATFESHGGWGRAPFPLLPKVLRETIGNRKVTHYLVGTNDLPFIPTCSQLDQSIWDTIDSISISAADSLRKFFRDKFRLIRAYPIMDLTHFELEDLSSLPLSRRSFNVMRSEFSKLRSLGIVRYHHLVDLPNLGINSILEIACVMEYLHDNTKSHGESHQSSIFDYLNLVDSKQADPLECLSDKLKSSSDLSTDLPEVLRFFSPSQQIDKLSLRYGWADQKPKTLEEVGELYGVTRERIRQIEAKFEKKLPVKKIHINSLDKCLDLLTQSAILTVEEASKLILEKHLSSKPVSIEGIVKHAAVLFAKNNDLDIVTVHGCKFVVKKTGINLIELIHHEANAEVSKYGCGNVDELIEEILSNSPNIYSKEILTRDFAIKVLRGFGDVIFLDKNCNWFWYETKRNRLINVLKKIFTVTKQLDVAQIREGLQRSYRQRSLRLVPSKEAIIEICKLLPNFFVEETTIHVNELFKQEDRLGDIEKAFFKALSESENGVLTRNDLLDRIQELGISDVSGSGYLSWSPILEQVAVNLWGLRGRVIDPVKIKYLTEMNLFNPKPTIKSDWGWTPERSLYIVYKLNKSSIRSGVFPLFSSFSAFLTEKNYPLIDVQSEKVGVLAINEEGTQCWGISAYLRRVDADENDYLVVDIDLQKQLANIKIGDYELVSEYV